MISIKNKLAIRKMEAAASALNKVFKKVPSILKSGITTLDLDSALEQEMKLLGLVSKAKGYRGYKHSTCISINDEIVHGVPKGRIIEGGDLVKVDICASLNGYCADMARCFFVDDVDPRFKVLVDAAQIALDAGIKKAVPGNRLSDISFAIQQEVEKRGFGVVRDFAGHGIGKKMHEEPQILNYGDPGEGPLLREGMVFAIEPMITEGDYSVVIDKDGWTARTKDGSYAAHVEDTVVITRSGPKILTRA